MTCTERYLKAKNEQIFRNITKSLTDCEEVIKKVYVGKGNYRNKLSNAHLISVIFPALIF